MATPRRCSETTTSGSSATSSPDSGERGAAADGNGASSTEALVERVEAKAENRKKVTLGEILGVAGTRSYGPLLLLPAVIALSPLGAVPGIALVAGSLIVLIAGQLAFGRKHPWMPAFLLGIKLPAKTVAASARKAEKPARWVDKLLSVRLTGLCDPPFAALPALACILLAVTFYPLEFVPFGVAAPSAAVTVLALAFTARDGLLMIVGLTAAAAAVGFAVWIFF
jgi:hypothetical protein